ncbi:trypsin-like serine protease [Streptomyces netropsis]
MAAMIAGSATSADATSGGVLQVTPSTVVKVNMVNGPCSGALIAPHWALTVAHCNKGISSVSRGGNDVNHRVDEVFSGTSLGVDMALVHIVDEVPPPEGTGMHQGHYMQVANENDEKPRAGAYDFISGWGYGGQSVPRVIQAKVIDSGAAQTLATGAVGGDLGGCTHSGDSGAPQTHYYDGVEKLVGVHWGAMVASYPYCIQYAHHVWNPGVRDWIRRLAGV